jgi:hypothetical protein
MTFIHAGGDHYSQGCLWPERIRYAFDPNNEMFTQSDLNQFEKTVGPFLPRTDEFRVPPVCGRLGQSLEGAGKRRKRSLKRRSALARP